MSDHTPLLFRPSIRFEQAIEIGVASGQTVQCPGNWIRIYGARKWVACGKAMLRGALAANSRAPRRKYLCPHCRFEGYLREVK